MKSNLRQMISGIIVLVLVGFGVTMYFMNKQEVESGITEKKTSPSGEFAYQNKGLRTNTAQTSIPLEKVLDGGPGKDGIPALTNPEFTSIKVAEKDIDPDIDGLVVTVGKEVKFYPYNIMVWHEIVNDIVGGKSLTVTFCPLCGSAIVFEAEIDGRAEEFGVSGKLYESNLLMYDKSTESLWSQSIGTAVVGDRVGEKLTVYPSQVMSFEAFKKKWPEGEVLSIDTGFRRNYEHYPYGDYNDDEEIFFPVSVRDSRFFSKEIMFVVNAYDKSVAFPVSKLSESLVSVEVDGKKVTGTITDGEIIVKNAEGDILPGYHEMWFSWATHHQEDGIVWDPKSE